MIYVAGAMGRSQSEIRQIETHRWRCGIAGSMNDLCPLGLGGPSARGCLGSSGPSAQVQLNYWWALHVLGQTAGKDLEN